VLLSAVSKSIIVMVTNTTMSRQKTLIYDIVASTMSHPTADWVYEQARTKMPRISLGTVYRNLKQLTAEGKLLEINTSHGGASRFDANLSKHSHLRCARCNRLEDIPQREIDFVPKSRLRRYRILEFRIEFLGICPACSVTSNA
jgi:Fur family peroxide stress response transcriptional regulator